MTEKKNNFKTFIFDKISILFKFKWVLVICVILSMLMGLYLSKHKSAKIFSHSEALVYSSQIENNIGGILILELRKNLINSDFVLISDKLNLGIEIVSTIKDINIEVQEKYQHDFKITIKTTTDEYIEIIEKSIINYLNSSTLIKSIMSVDLLESEHRIKNSNRQLVLLDSLTSRVLKEGNNIGTFLKSKIEIQEMVDDYKKDLLDQKTPFIYLYGFESKMDNSIELKFSEYILISFFMGLIVSIGIIIIISISKNTNL